MKKEEKMHLRQMIKLERLDQSVSYMNLLTKLVLVMTFTVGGLCLYTNWNRQFNFSHAGGGGGSSNFTHENHLVKRKVTAMFESH